MFACSTVMTVRFAVRVYAGNPLTAPPARLEWLCAENKRRHPGRRAWLTGFGPVVGALTAIAFAVRLLGFHESLFADEIYSYWIVANYGFLDMVREVHDTAITPPLHYLLAHGAVKFGEDATWIRMPSIVLGTATVPLV